MNAGTLAHNAQLEEAEFTAALAVIKRAGRSYERACKLAEVTEAFVTDLDGLSGLKEVEDAAAQLTFSLSNCYAPPAQLAVYRRAA